MYSLAFIALDISQMEDPEAELLDSGESQSQDDPYHRDSDYESEFHMQSVHKSLICYDYTLLDLMDDSGHNSDDHQESHDSSDEQSNDDSDQESTLPSPSDTDSSVSESTEETVVQQEEEVEEAHEEEVEEVREEEVGVGEAQEEAVGVGKAQEEEVGEVVKVFEPAEEKKIKIN